VPLKLVLFIYVANFATLTIPKKKEKKGNILLQVPHFLKQHSFK
jgi:hypothetical protein